MGHLSLASMTCDLRIVEGEVVTGRGWDSAQAVHPRYGAATIGLALFARLDDEVLLRTFDERFLAFATCLDYPCQRIQNVGVKHERIVRNMLGGKALGYQGLIVIEGTKVTFISVPLLGDTRGSTYIRIAVF